MGWHVRAVALPSGRSPVDIWIDAAGCSTLQPVADAENLPGRYALHGLVDAHAHPAITPTPQGPAPQDVEATASVLRAWARAGIGFVRDMGSPGGITLLVPGEPGMPQTLAAGRFLAPAERYFPSLLPEPAPEEELASSALAELARGARWVKIIADFPWVVDGAPTGDSEPTYSIETISAVVSTVHDAGGRVAVHANTSLASALVEAGVDSIEHGMALDADDLARMAQQGTAWTPTLCAIFGAARESDPEELRSRRAVARERLVEMIPQAARMGVPILAGTDAAGTIADEVRLLAEFGLDPTRALEAATTSAYRFLRVDPGRPGEPATLVTYDDDPRDDPRVLGSPRAVVIGGRRVT